MSYATIEAGVVTVIIKHADFSTTNCKARDSSPIKKGLARVCAVSYGTHSKEEISIRSHIDIWTLNVDVYVPWRGDNATHQASLNTETQKVIDTLSAWPKLDATAGVIDTNVLNAAKPFPLAEKFGSYRGQRLSLEVQEAVTTTRSE